MKLLLKLGLTIYIIIVLGLSAFSEASFTDNFLKSMDSQLHSKMVDF